MATRQDKQEKTPKIEDSGYRIEYQATREWITARTEQLDEQRFVLRSPGEVPVGAPLNVLIYLPRADDVDLIRTRARAVRCDEQQGVFEIEARLEVFAPGDERKWRLWWRAQPTDPARPATRAMRAVRTRVA